MNFKQLSQPEKLSLYYPAISCVQKAIRRSKFEYAKLPALVAWHLYGPRFKSRIQTILNEDCGREYNLIKYLHENIDEVWKTSEGMLRVIKAMCDGFKNRECTNMILAAENKCTYFSGIRKIQEQFGGLLELRAKKTSYDQVLREFEKLGYFVPSWLADYLINNKDRERLYFYLPYFYNIDMSQSYRVFNTFDDDLMDETYEDLFLLDGVDSHTRAGKKCWSIAKRKGMLDKLFYTLPEPYQNKTGWAELSWYTQSAHMRNYIAYDNNHPDFESQIREEILTSQVMNAYIEAFPQLNGLKRWLINSDCKMFIEACLYFT